ncbi:hypothetical protein HDK77DRAFT_495116, partial [Phyllosticta capitalensis]
SPPASADQFPRILCWLSASRRDYLAAAGCRRGKATHADISQSCRRVCPCSPAAPWPTDTGWRSRPTFRTEKSKCVGGLSNLSTNLDNRQRPQHGYKSRSHRDARKHSRRAQHRQRTAGRHRSRAQHRQCKAGRRRSTAQGSPSSWRNPGPVGQEEYGRARVSPSLSRKSEGDGQEEGGPSSSQGGDPDAGGSPGKGGDEDATGSSPRKGTD